MSKVTPLAEGQITPADRLTVELHQPPDTPAFVLLRWPEQPSVTSTDPRGLASVARSVVGVVAEAQARLAQIKRKRL